MQKLNFSINLHCYPQYKASWRAEQYDNLASHLDRHAYNYFKEHPERLKRSFNRISADLVIQNIFRDNAWKFLRRWF